MGTTEDERLFFREDIARLIGVKVSSLSRYKLPPPDDYKPDEGHYRPVWRESTARAWAASRPGKGWRKGKRGPHKGGAAGSTQPQDQ